MTVLAPSSAQELSVMFEDALATTDGPVAIRFPKTKARAARPDEVGSGLRARRAREGDGQVAILSVGKLLDAAEEAADALAAEGVSATVWDVRVCKPLDPEMLADAARHRVVVTAEDGIREGGVGSAIADAVGGSGSLEGAPRVIVLGTPIEYLAHGKPDAILGELGLDGTGIADAARRVLGSTVRS
jgi:1-deoxy-D-xylulose-5-phosphate synthase